MGSLSLLALQFLIWKGLETETPFVKITDTVYQGRWEMAPGTDMFFSQKGFVLWLLQ